MERRLIVRPPEFTKISPFLLQEDHQKLSILTTDILSAGDYGGSLDETVANGAYFLANRTHPTSFFEVAEGLDHPFIANKFTTRRERERIFVLTNSSDDNKLRAQRYLDGQIQLMTDSKGNELRFVIPEFLFSNADIESLLKNRMKIKKYPDIDNPTNVARFYINKDLFIKDTNDDKRFKSVVLDPSNEDELIALYKDNYKRSSFDAHRLESGLYKGYVEVKTGKIVSATGSYMPFFVEGYGEIAIVCDTVRMRGDRYKGLGRKSLSDVVDGLLRGNDARRPCRLIVGDSINARSVDLVGQLGADIASKQNWYVVQKL